MYGWYERAPDEEHVITYLCLLDAVRKGADWREVTRVVLHLDPELESDRARRAFESHLSRAKWMTEQGYRHLLRGGASGLNVRDVSRFSITRSPCPIHRAIKRNSIAGLSAQRPHASA
jgi:hypothetical protein